MRVTSVGVIIGLALLAAPMARAQNVLDFEGYDVGTQVVFQNPDFSGSTDANLVGDDSTSAVTDEKAFSGTKSEKIDFAWVDNDPARWVRITTNSAPNLPNPTIDFTSTLSMKVFVASQDPLGFAIGVRETNTSADILANGGASGGIEFLGSSTGSPPTPVASHIITPGSWQDLVFDIPNETVKAFAGATANGTLESTTGKGVLEHLAVRSPGTGNAVTFYIDDLRIGPDTGVIPEPGSMALLATGLLPLLAFRRRR